MKLLIVSDLHVYNKADSNNKGSIISTDISLVNPLSGLLKFCEEENIRADLLVCPGDLGNKADLEGISFGWEKMHELARVVKAKNVVGVSGNHDIDSTLQNDEFHDAREHLVYMEPDYPTWQKRANSQYWTYGYYSITTASYNLIGLNTCHFHGFGASEMKHGRVSDKTLVRLIDEAKKLPPRDINILLCHHQPAIISMHSLGEDDFVRNGTELLNGLASMPNSRWIVIHGHKHYPKIFNAPGATNAPIIFSSGSLGAILYDELRRNTGNQFHLMEFDEVSFEKYGMVGSVKSWEWNGTSDWKKAARGDDNIQHYNGFGYNLQVTELANLIRDFVGNSLRSSSEIYEQFPQLNYIYPDDLLRIKQRLLTLRIGMEIEQGRVTEVGVMPL